MDNFQVIRTKLFPPVSRTRLVNRTTLLDKLDAAAGARLVLVAAPAGFGKTTLLGQWIARQASDGEKICWCSLEYADNNPQRFLRHLVAALQVCNDKIGINVLQLINNTLVNDISDTLAMLIDDISSCNNNIRLFVDDYHYINEDEINQFMELLINLAPDNLRMVLSGRIWPSLSLSGLKLREELHEFNAGDLRFDEMETREYLTDTLGLDLSTDQVDDLYNHSEGWAAGLQLASLSMKDPAVRSEFIATFSGKLRDIADYLTSAVLSLQPEEIHDFLLRTSVLDRMNAGVCSELIGNNTSQQLLEQIEKGNLFLVPLDANSEWFRYHHLFQEYLQSQLRKIYPAEIVGLYKKAAQWFADAGYINEAVNYALLSGDTRLLGRLIHSGSMEHLSMDGKMAELLSWVSNIPGNIKIKFPRLLMQECIALTHLSRPVEANIVARQAGDAIDRLESLSDYEYNQDELKQIRDENLILPFMIRFCEDDVDNLINYLPGLSETEDDLILAMANNFYGYACLQNARFSEAEQYLQKGAFHHVTRGTYYGAIFSDCFQAMACLQQLKLHMAMDHCCIAEQRNRKISGGHTAGYAKSQIVKAAVYYEWNDLPTARDLLDRYLGTVHEAGQVSFPQLGYLVLSRCHSRLGDFDAARMALDRAIDLSRHTISKWIHLQVELELQAMEMKDRAAYKTGTDMPGDRLDALTAQLHRDWNRITCAEIQAGLQSLYLNGDYEHYLQAVTVPVQLLDARRIESTRLRLVLLGVMCHLRLDQVELALQTLLPEIDLLAKERASRVMLDFMPELTPVLKRALDQPDASVAMRSFITRLVQEDPWTAARQSAVVPEQSGAVVKKCLARREVDVLRLIARGESNAAISEQLLISENTVKWHLKNIFAKLSVNNRTAAVVQAQQKNLL